jgi:ATP-dependent DNA helicase RecQ
MVTFSRAAATEFKQRLYELIGNAAAFIEIKTFHSYCFDLIGRIGSLTDAKTVVTDASEMIKNGDVEIGRITKTVLVIDEAQDMDKEEYELVSALIDRNDDLRVIAVGDDDQNIYEFRGSSSDYFKSFLDRDNSKKYELLDNYRSQKSIVDFANNSAKSINNRLKSTPIISKNDKDGKVELIQCQSKNLEEPVACKAKDICSDGTVCVLTSTNNEAFKVMGLLREKGVRAKLIQTNDGFDLYNMSELRIFMKNLEKKLTTPIIDDESWNYAKNIMTKYCEKSTNFELCLNILDTFEKSNNKKYKTDLYSFLHESKLEDFFDSKSGEVVVSTIHKSKGREFDKVIMLLDNVLVNTDTQKRLLYVGMTRAKNELYIFYNNKDFDKYITPTTRVKVDDKIYPSPNKIRIQLSHRDVNLGFFIDKKEIIGRMISGAKLEPNGNILCITNPNGNKIQVVRFSQKFIDELESYKRQGYAMIGAAVRFVVGWWNTADEQVYPIILPDVVLEKSHFQKSR